MLIVRSASIAGSSNVSYAFCQSGELLLGDSYVAASMDAGCYFFGGYTSTGVEWRVGVGCPAANTATSLQAVALCLSVT